jgi:putative peptidoglycan lipid II flippase
MREAPPPGLLRAGAGVAAWNLVSRLTGFVRVLAVGAAVGTTYLGNTYQSANVVSNVLFELLAAGVLSSVLVPTFVGRLATGGRRETARLAGAVLGAVLAVLTPVVVAAMLAAGPIMRLLTVAVEDPAVRAQQVAVGRFFLWFFVPQVLLYAVGAVATGALHADNRFAAAAAAPVANNVVVTATMVAFVVVRHGPLSLALPVGERLLLAAGTTAGVAFMSAIPLVAAWRAGLRLRPRWAPGLPELRAMARKGAWAGVWLAATQVLLAVTLVLANRVAGGVVAFQVAFTFFQLPFALGAHPVLTALYPRLAADAHAGDLAGFARRLAGGVKVTALVVLPASALLVAGARPLLDTVAVGALATGSPLVARTLAAYAVGLAGYAGFQLLTRACYALGDARAPALVNLAATGAGVLLMGWWSAQVSGEARVVVLGLAYSAVQTGAALALFALLTRRLGRGVAGATVARAAVAAAAGGAAAYGVVRALGGAGRPAAAGVLAVASLAGVLVYAGVLAPGPAAVRRLRAEP